MRVLLVLLGVVFLAGCGDDDEKAATSGGSLEGVAWVLNSGIDVAGFEQVAPTASFEGGRLSGFTGCNQYTTSYKTDGDSIEIGEVASSLMACPPPGDDVQAAFTSALSKVSAYQVDDDELVLSDDGGDELLRFSAASPVGSWEATAFLQGDAISSPIAGTRVTADFEESGTLSGNAGCNNYTATFKLDGSSLTVTPPAATKKLCTSPEGVMEQEHAYLVALGKTVSYSLQGDTLTLLRPGGTIAATFTRSGASGG